MATLSQTRPLVTGFQIPSHGELIKELSCRIAVPVAAMVNEALRFPDLPAEARKLLVVEDEVLIRMAIAEYLRDCGYVVVEASNALEAMTLLDVDFDIELVFTDVDMPGDLDGFGLTLWIRQNHPSVKVMLTSGYMKTAQVAENSFLLAKPYHPQLVEERIRMLLAQSRAAGS